MTEKPQDKKLAAYRRGFLAEYVTALFLLVKGYHIVAMRYRSKGGEVDIIARKGDLAVFVEVKARRSIDDALSAVGFATQRRIEAASLHWLSRQKDAPKLSRRYDIVAVLPWRLPVHFRDVF
jgi:putative endonuclease